jgi:hypothetical protein
MFLIGKYQGTLLIAISCDANNKLVPLVFALVEKQNNDSWGWFLRLVRIHVVGPGRKVGVTELTKLYEHKYKNNHRSDQISILKLP